MSPAVLAPVIAKFGPHSRLVLQSGSTFASLSRSIVYQQLAGSAADAIFKRVLLRCEVRNVGKFRTPPPRKPEPTSIDVLTLTLALTLSCHVCRSLNDLRACSPSRRVCVQCEGELSPAAVLAVAHEELRGCGLSNNKVRFVRLSTSSSFLPP